MELTDAIAPYHLIALDTNPFIYLFEKHPQYFRVVQPLFARLDGNPAFRAITSAAALAMGAEAFVTNDAALKRVTEIPVLVLSDFVR